MKVRYRSVMELVIGGLSGAVFAAGVWWASHRFLRRYGVEAEGGGALSTTLGLPGSVGSVPALLAVLVAAMAVWGAYASWRAPSIALAAAALVVTALLLTVTIVDFRSRRIPDALCLALGIWAVVQTEWLGQPTARSVALGAAVGAGLFLSLALIQRGAMGAGDVKLAAALGAVLGYPLVLRGLLSGIVVAGLVAVFLLATGRASRKDTMAYGPYLAFAAWLVWTRSLGLWF